MRNRLWIGVASAAVAATLVGGASGVTGSDTITTIAGTGQTRASALGGLALAASLYLPSGVAVDAAGNVYVSETERSHVYRVTPAGRIARVAASTKLATPNGLAVDAQGNLYIAESGGSRVRKVTPAGRISTFAGTGVRGSSGDGGPATSARLDPAAIAVDAQGNVYVTDQSTVRKVGADGTITRFAGMAGPANRGFAGDGGPATSAKLNGPSGLAVDAQGNVYIYDELNARVRKVDAAGTISTVVGTGVRGFSGDGGPATSARISGRAAGGAAAVRRGGLASELCLCHEGTVLLTGLAVDREGSLYVADPYNDRVRKVSGGTITTIAGTGRPTSGGDGGPAGAAGLSAPSGVAVDAQGNLLVVEWSGSRVRRIGAPAALYVTLGGPASQRLSAQRGVTLTARCDKPCALTATGSVDVNGMRESLGLTRATARLAAGTRTLTLRLSAASERRFRRASADAYATITVQASDGDGHTTFATRVVKVRLTSAPAPARAGGGATAGAGLRTFVVGLEGVLLESAAGRRELAAALTAGFACSISPRVAGQRVAHVVTGRERLHRRLAGFRAPTRQAGEALALLRQALRHSIDADRLYRDGFLGYGTAAALCPLPPNRSFTLARTPDALASAAKRRFVAAYNPLARSVHRRTWSATEI